MSCTFRWEDRAVWSPANQVAALYLGMIEVAAEVVGKPAGVQDRLGSGDAYDLDPVEYPVLVTEMLRFFADSRHPQLRLMIGSLLGVSIGILDEAGIEIEARDERERQSIIELREAAF